MIAMPCGLAAKTHFNDTFTLQQVDKLGGQGKVLKTVEQGTADITWYKDKVIRQNLNEAQI